MFSIIRILAIIITGILALIPLFFDLRGPGRKLTKWGITVSVSMIFSIGFSLISYHSDLKSAEQEKEKSELALENIIKIRDSVNRTLLPISPITISYELTLSAGALESKEYLSRLEKCYSKAATALRPQKNDNPSIGNDFFNNVKELLPDGTYPFIFGRLPDGPPILITHLTPESSCFPDKESETTIYNLLTRSNLKFHIYKQPINDDLTENIYQLPDPDISFSVSYKPADNGKILSQYHYRIGDNKLHIISPSFHKEITDAKVSGAIIGVPDLENAQYLMDLNGDFNYPSKEIEVNQASLSLHKLEIRFGFNEYSIEGANLEEKKLRSRNALIYSGNFKKVAIDNIQAMNALKEVTVIDQGQVVGKTKEGNPIYSNRVDNNRIKN